MTAPAFEFDFRSRSPKGVLARFVESLWYARGTVPYAREKIAPTGSTVAVFVLGDPIIQISNNGDGDELRAENGFLVGPHDGPAVNEPTGETFAVGIVTTPIGCESIFGVPPRTVRGQAVELLQAWSDADDLRRKLLERANPDAMLDLMESHLAANHAPALPGVERCERAVSMLQSDPTQQIGTLADTIGVSHAHLDREFTRVVGLSPRALARLFRMRELLSRIDVRAPVDWTDLAAEMGWFDQAHLIRDFKRHTGTTPTQYIAAQREAFGSDESVEAPGFVPEF